MVQGTFNSVDNEIENLELEEIGKISFAMNDELNETRITKKSVKQLPGA